jgi:membrane protease YdiL (CAAX protease family)
VLVWLATPDLPWPSRLWTTFLVGVLPILLIAQARIAGQAMELPRTSIYASSAISLWILAAVTMIVAIASDFTPAGLGFARLPIPGAVGWIAAVTGLGVAVLFAARAIGVREPPIVEYLMPRTRRENIAFFGLSATAGVCEELVFRGYLIPVLDYETGSIVIAVVMSSALFGVLHAYQRPAGAVRAGILGAILAAPLLATGSILPSIIAHAAIDIIAGIWLRDRLIR